MEPGCSSGSLGMSEHMRPCELEASHHSGATFHDQGRHCGALGDVSLAGPELQQEAKVQSTVSACQGGGHHDHMCLQGPYDQSKVSGVWGMLAIRCYF